MRASAREDMKAKKQALVQDEIISTTVKLFSDRGFRAVTIDDIASSLGFTKSVIYYYFKSKHQILWEIFTRIWDSYLSLSRRRSKRDFPRRSVCGDHHEARAQRDGAQGLDGDLLSR